MHMDNINTRNNARVPSSQMLIIYRQSKDTYKKIRKELPSTKSDGLPGEVQRRSSR